jgi:hypothetical protein
MVYRVKNISNQVFSMEGVTLQPGAISHDLTPEEHQRLLAVAYGKALMPVDESTYGDSKLSTLPEVPAAGEQTVAEPAVEPAAEPGAPAPVEAAPVVAPEFKCEEHDKTFKTQNYLNMHIKAAHKSAEPDVDEDETVDEE